MNNGITFPEGIQNKITISVPNVDTNLGIYTVCPKEVLQKAYIDKIGGTIEFCEATMRVVDVRITDEFIFMDLVHVNKNNKL